MMSYLLNIFMPLPYFPIHHAGFREIISTLIMRAHFSILYVINELTFKLFCPKICITKSRVKLYLRYHEVDRTINKPRRGFHTCGILSC